MTTDLVTWLRQQLDEEEAHARKDIWCAERASNGGHWQARYGHNLPHSELWANGEIGRLTATQGKLADGEEDQHAADAMLVARMVRSAKRRAERALREVDAKRRILTLHHSKPAGGFDADGWEHYGYACDVCYFADAYPCPTLKLLALPHADRPGYREEWRP